MPTVADIGFGATVTYGTVPVTVAQLVAVNGVSVSADDVEVTNNSSAGGWREMIQGLKTVDDITLNLITDPAELALLITEFTSGAQETWTITLPSGPLGASTFAVSAHIKGVSTDVPLDDVVTTEVVLRPTGAPTYTDNS